MAKGRGKSPIQQPGPSGTAPPSQPAPPGDKSSAAAAFARGDFKRARKLASETLASGPEADREAARRFLRETSPDPAAWITAAAVLAVIALAAILALFRR